jgi:hypothetical protein
LANIDRRAGGGGGGGGDGDFSLICFLSNDGRTVAWKTKEEEEEEDGLGTNRPAAQGPLGPFKGSESLPQPDRTPSDGGWWWWMRSRCEPEPEPNSMQLRQPACLPACMQFIGDIVHL